MNRVDLLSMLIRQQYGSNRKFAQAISMPSTTLNTILAGRINTASLENIEKICAGLHIEVQTLLNADSLSEPPFIPTKRDIELIRQYDANPEMQPAINRILGLE